MKNWLVVIVVGSLFAAISYVSTPKQETLMAKCKDGTISYSKKRSGTCSHHGGVVEWSKK